MNRSGAVIHGYLLTMDGESRVLDDGGILWENGEILAVDTSDDILKMAREKGLDILDARGSFLLPGLINTHGHLFQHLVKGIGADLPLEIWWHKTIKPLALSMSPLLLQAAVYGGVQEALLSGTTTLVDYMYAHPRSGLMEVELEALEKTGIRAVYGRGYRTSGEDRGFPVELIEKPEDVFREVEVFKKITSDSLLNIWLAPAALWALDKATLLQTSEFSLQTSTPCMIHILETEEENRLSLKLFGKKSLKVYGETGILDTELLAVHCVKVDNQEIELFKEKEVKISYNPVSNMYLGSGVAPVPEYLAAGIPVGLGTDGAASNNTVSMLETLKHAVLLQKVAREKASALCAEDALRMATIEGARSLGMDHLIGSLEPGKRADFILYDPMEEDLSVPWHDPVATLVYSSGSKGVRYTAVDGQYLVKEGVSVLFDPSDVRNMLQNAARSIKKLYT